jgi:hypothetical protein
MEGRTSDSKLNCGAAVPCQEDVVAWYNRSFYDGLDFSMIMQII